MKKIIVKIATAVIVLGLVGGIIDSIKYLV